MKFTIIVELDYNAVLIQIKIVPWGGQEAPIGN